MLLAGCGRTSSHARISRVPPAVRDADVEALNRVLDLEHETIAAYTAGIPLLTGASRSAAQRFLGQELSHAGELSRLVRQAGGRAHRPQPSYDLGAPRNGDDILALLRRLEGDQIAAYIDVLPSLSPGAVRATLASILANEAQHISILRGALRREPAPSAFVTGQE